MTCKLKKKCLYSTIFLLFNSGENNQVVRKKSTKKTVSAYLIGTALGRASTRWKLSQYSLFCMGGDKGVLFQGE